MGVVFKWTDKQIKSIIKSYTESNKSPSKIANGYYSAKLIDGGGYVIIRQGGFNKDKHLHIKSVSITTIINILIKHNVFVRGRDKNSYDNINVKVSKIINRPMDDIALYELSISLRLKNILKKLISYNRSTLADLESVSVTKLLNSRNSGVKTINEFINLCRLYNIPLKY